jgi:hypothetical protein
VWRQQGQKLAGSDAVGTAKQGRSVALSADGNTAIVGGGNDDGDAGAAWVWTRSNGAWTQQGSKLVGSGAVEAAQQGTSVAVSADGNTTVVGGPFDSSGAGAAWVFTRSNGVWTQQGEKLVGTGAVGGALQGFSVALSADGNTAVVGGRADNGNAGAAWVFTRSNGAWTQQGGKLVGTGAVGNADQGFSVALSADGNTAIVGGFLDDNAVGAAWVFTRSNGVWTQQGGKLAGTGAVGSAQQGFSVGVSADGSTVIIGGDVDNQDVGAAWIFFRDPAASHDFNGNGISDIAWRDTSGNAAIWLMNGNGAQVANSGVLGTVPTNWTIVGQRDFNNDGKDDWLWRDGTSGTVAIWLLDGLQVGQSGVLGVVGSNWTIAGTGDFNGDGAGDILWREAGGNTAIWLIDGLQVPQSGSLGIVPMSWSVVGVTDFNGDGRADILWRDTSGNVAIWLMNGLSVQGSSVIGQVATTWSVAATGDFNDDGNGDVLWRDAGIGALAIWFMNGVQLSSIGSLGMVPSSWSIGNSGDFNIDGRSDILWRDATTGAAAIWFMNGAQIIQSAGLGQVPLSWTIQGLNAD